jgi:hypothetical protein
LQNTNFNAADGFRAGKEFYKTFFPEEIYRVESHVQEIKSESDAVSDNGITIYLDGNKMAETLLLFNLEGNELPAGADGELLSKILESAGIITSETAWLNLGNFPGARWADILLACNARNIIAFGLNHMQLPAGMKPGQIFHAHDRRCISTLSLAMMQNNKAAKLQLWNLLKELYGR